VESVQIKFTSDHPWPGDVAVHLVSPSGSESRLININSNIYSDGYETDTLMISNAFYGEESEGYWTIKMYDGDDLMGTGSLLNWKIQINGHISPLETMHPMPVTGMNFGPVPISSSMTPTFTFIHSSSLLTLDHYEAAIGTSAFDEDIKGWTNIGLNDNAQRLTGLTLSNGVTYYLKIRAFNGFGYSSVQILPWKADF
jgi:subtilisin-like proprotein convertase family protein